MGPTDEQKGLFILRITLGGFLLLWGLDKIFAPESTVKIFENFYFLGINPTWAMGIGVLEILLSIMIIVGLWKRFSYGVGTLVHGISTLSTYKQLLDPFGKNHLFIAAIPILGAFLALYFLRKKDTWLAVSK